MSISPAQFRQSQGSSDVPASTEMSLATTKGAERAPLTPNPELDAIEQRDDRPSRSKLEEGTIPTGSGGGQDQVRGHRNTAKRERIELLTD